MNIAAHYKNNYKNLLAVAKKNVTDNCQFLAEECVNQTYTKLITFIKAGNPVDLDQVDGLAYRILFNCIHDCNEAELKRGMTGSPDDRMVFTETVEQCSGDDIDLNTFRSMCLRVVLGKYKRKSLKKDRLLSLFFVQGLSHREIAHELDVTEKTSRNIVYQELQNLRKGDFGS